MFTDCMLYIRLYCKNFTYIIVFKPYNSPFKKVLLLLLLLHYLPFISFNA